MELENGKNLQQGDILKSTMVVDPGSKHLEQQINEALDRKGQNLAWIRYLFLIATLPNILNGFHVSSYIFVGKMPDSYWCEIPVLLNATWTKHEMIQISTGSTDPNSCSIFKYNYKHLSTMDFESAQEYVQTQSLPEHISCLSSTDGHMQYSIEGSSIVPEWDLVCENTVWRTTVQVAVSFGKCIAASIIGILSDRFGRKKLFAVGCVLYTLASFMCTFSPWYWVFLIGRVMLGSSASGLLYPPQITMSENVTGHHRHWMNILSNASYPVGMLYLAAAGYFLTTWRDLQLALTLPALLLAVFWYLMKESPRWLLSKGRSEEAYKVVFGKPVDIRHFTYEKTDSTTTYYENKTQLWSFQRIYRSVWYSTFTTLFNYLQYRVFTASFSYYVTAINATNLSADKVVYVSVIGGVDILAYLAGTLLLTYVGRKWSCFWAYAVSAACMLALLLLPKDDTNAIVTISMVGRLGITAVYGMIALYTIELYPTEVRNSAIGVCSMCGHIGSMTAPFVVDFLGAVAWFIPTTVCGIIMLLAGLLLLLNPETSQMKLVDHVNSEDNNDVRHKDQNAPG